MPENWKTYQFANAPLTIMDGDRGKNYPKSNEFKSKGHCLFLSAKNVTKTGFQFSEKFFISKERDELLGKGKLEKYDLVLTTRGTVGNVAYYGDGVPFEHIRINSGMVIIRVKKEALEDKFLYFFLRSPNFKNQVLSNQTGSAQPQLPIRDLKTLKIKLPPLPEQKSIASILSALDDKIELNLQINKTLEEMAMALYKHWFVDFGPFQDGEFVATELGEIPKGWEVKNIKEIAEVNSKSINKNAKLDIIEYIDIASVGEGLVENIQPLLLSEAPSRARRIISDGDIVWSTVRPNRKSRFLALGFNNRTIVSTGFAVTSPKKVPYSFLYPFTCTENFVDYLVSRATGSSYPAVTGKIFEEAKLVVPTQNILEKYNEIVEPLYLQFSKNDIENQTLTQLRDTLLPKLISGEVRVKDAEKTLSEVL